MCNHPALTHECCACLLVRFDPVTHSDGSKTDRWRCKDCGARFIRGEQMPGPIVPSDFSLAGDTDAAEMDEPCGRTDDDLHRRVQHLSTQLLKLSPVLCLSTETAYEATKEALQELDDLRLIATDLHSLAAAAWQHIRATAPDDKQRVEANAVCDKLLEGGPLWLCSPTPPAVGSGLCNVATVGIAEANRDRARMMTIGFPLWKLALELARRLYGAANLLPWFEGRPCGTAIDTKKAVESALGRLTEGGDLWWLGEGDKNAQAWGLMTIGTVRCAACGNEITPPAHLLSGENGNNQLAPVCSSCWDIEEAYVEAGLPDAGTGLGASRQPSGIAQLPLENLLPFSLENLLAFSGARERVLRAALAVANMAKNQGRPDLGAAAWTWTAEEQELVDAADELERGDPNAQPRTDGDAVSQLGATGGSRETPSLSGGHESLLRGAAERMVEALKHDHLPNAGDRISDAFEALKDALGEPDELEVLRHQLRLADHAINALCVHAGPEQQRKWGSREAVQAYRAALPHPLTGKTLAPVLLAAGALATVLHQPGAVGTLELAIRRCRCDSEPNSLNDLAARLLEAVLAQHNPE